MQATDLSTSMRTRSRASGTSYRPTRTQADETLGQPPSAMDVYPLPTSPNPELQASNEGRRKLAIHLQGVTGLELAVRIESAWEK